MISNTVYQVPVRFQRYVSLENKDSTCYTHNTFKPKKYNIKGNNILCETKKLWKRFYEAAKI